MGMAQAPLPDPHSGWGSRGLAAASEPDSAFKPFGEVKVAIAAAIDAAGKQGNGRVVEISFDHKDGAGWYLVAVATPAGLHYLRVDAGSGDVKSAQLPDIPEAAFDREARAVLSAIMTAKYDLAQAVAAAEKVSGGKAIAAGMEQIGGIPQYYIQTVAKGKLRSVIIDPQTGQA